MTPKPLNIYVAPEWYRHTAVLDLMRAGHQVHNMAKAHNVASADLILHPAAHGWNDEMWPYLPAALVAARRRKEKK